jgi:hypothetical protein
MKIPIHSVFAKPFSQIILTFPKIKTVILVSVQRREDQFSTKDQVSSA